MAEPGTRIEVHGTVQGVGFRPFVYRLASDLGLSGDVRNTAGHVVIRAMGPRGALEALRARLVAEAPPQSRIAGVSSALLPADLTLATGFRVLDSAPARPGARPEPGLEIPPDLAPCVACRIEMADPTERRFRYPFTNCVDCGPRVSIIDDLPYDRRRTAMRGFPLCAECMREYQDPANRRFHAEPVACPACGPQLTWCDGPSTGSIPGAGSIRRAEEALQRCEQVILDGGLVAIKGVGGYQLVCDAGQDGAVRRLRSLKLRPRKPFALMVRDAEAARRLADVGADEARLLLDVSAPIVLLTRRPDAPVAPAVAPGLRDLGIFLPSSPLHHLLLADLDRPLVVTSGNRSSEPIIIDDEQAEQVLGPCTDGILRHDRPIRARYDDSIQRMLARQPMTIRRARGLAPTPLPLPVRAREPILAVGAQLKHTVTVAFADQAVIGAHLGDLEDAGTFAAFQEAVATLGRLHGVEPLLVAHDPHPGYLSTRYAQRFAANRRIAVQHHHAHVVATAAEHGLTGPFLGVAYDGLGYGGDGTLWGGELMIADYVGYRRLARFGTAPLPGGEAAVRRPARMALGYLFGAERAEPELSEHLGAAFLARLPGREVETVRRMVAAGVNCPRASSAGRLFDAVAALLGLCDDAGYEGEAAIALETAAAAHPGGPGAVTALPWRVHEQDGLLVYDPTPTLQALLVSGGDPGELAARFHRTVAEVTAALVAEGVARTRVRQVCLGGGVFQNVLLSTMVLEVLRDAGLEVFIGREVPVNDGGISYGQAAVAAARRAEGG